MSSYRDDLLTADRRIERLEAELRTLPRASSQAWMWLLSALLVVSSFALVGLALRQNRAATQEAPSIVATAAPSNVRLFFGEEDVTPIVDARANDDDVDDLVVIVTSNDPTGGHRAELVALDGATWKPLWHVGSWPSTAAVGSRIFLAGPDRSLVVLWGTSGVVRAIDVKEGKDAGSFDLGQRPMGACANAAGGVLVFTTEGNKLLTFGTDHGSRGLVDAPPGDLSRCRTSGIPPCSEGSEPCVDEPNEPTPGGKLAAHAKYVRRDYVLFTGAALAGGALLPSADTRAPYALARTRAGAELWSGPLAVTTRAPANVRSEHLAWNGESIVIAYMDNDFDATAVARDGKSGRVAWSTVVRTPRRGVVRSVAVTKERAFVSVEGALTVLDMKSGARLAVIERIELPPSP